MGKNLEMKVILSAMDKVTAPLRGISRQINSVKTTYRKEMGDLNRTLKLTQNAYKGIQNQRMELQRRGKPITDAMIKGENALRQKIDATSKSIEKQKLVMDKRMRNLNRRQGYINRGGDYMRSGAMGMAKSAAMTYGISRFLGEGFEFDETMSRVQALTRLNKGDDQLKQLREQAKYLGATTWADPTQAAQGQAFYAMAGFSPENIMKAMPGTLDLARASGLDIGRAADIGSNILQGFGIDPSEMDRVGDILVGIFTRTNTSMEMLGESMKYAAPIAKKLGISMEESATMVGMLGNVGIQGGMAGRAMRNIYQNLGSKGTQAELKKLGISSVDKKGNLRDVPTLFAEILEKSKNMGNTEQLELLKSIAGGQAATAFAAMIDAGTLKDFRRVYEEVLKNHGESKQVALVMADNVAGDWEELSSSFTDWKITIGELNDGGIRNLLQNLNKVMDWIGKITKESPEWISFWSKTIGFVVALTGGIGALTFVWGLFNKAVLANPIIAGLTLLGIIVWQIYKNFDWLAKVWNDSGPAGKVVMAISGVAAVLGTSIVLVKSLAALFVSSKFLSAPIVFGKIATGIKAVSLALLANPWVIALAAIAGAIYLIYQNWDTLVDYWDRSFTYITGKITDLIEWFVKLKDAIFGAQEQALHEQWGLDRTQVLLQNPQSEELRRIINNPMPGEKDRISPQAIEMLKNGSPSNTNSNNTITNHVIVNAGSNASATDIANATTNALNRKSNTALLGDL